MKWLHFIASFLIWVTAYLPVVLLSFIAVPFLILCTNWSGATTIFGNTKYPMPIKHGSVSDPEDFLQTFTFYCLRNPVSNWGRLYLSNHQTWAWEYRGVTIGPITVDYGWALGDEPKFKFRPRIKQ
jgi:hypothetical protein